MGWESKGKQAKELAHSTAKARQFHSRLGLGQKAEEGVTIHPHEAHWPTESFLVLGTQSLLDGPSCAFPTKIDLNARKRTRYFK